MLLGLDVLIMLLSECEDIMLPCLISSSCHECCGGRDQDGNGRHDMVQVSCDMIDLVFGIDKRLICSDVLARRCGTIVIVIVIVSVVVVR